MALISGKYVRSHSNAFKIKEYKSAANIEALAHRLSNFCANDPSKNAHLKFLIMYLTIALRSRFSGLHGDKEIRFFNNNSLQGNFKLTLEGVTLYLQNKLSPECTMEDARKIISICTHRHTTVAAVEEYTKSAMLLFSSLQIPYNPKEELNTIRQALESSNLSNKYLMEIVSFCANKDLSHMRLAVANLKLLDLTQANLTEIDLPKAKLQNVNLHNAKLKLGRLSNTNLEKAKLTQAKLIGADLAKANLKEADLTEAQLMEANLENAVLEQATLNNANLAHANLTNANLTAANLFQATMISANLKNAELYGANLKEANLNNAILPNANLVGVDLTRARLENTQLLKTKLNHSILEQANLTEADLTQAELKHVKLAKANLTKATLTKANLSNADLTETNLTGATLEQVNLFQANLQGAILTGTKITLDFPENLDDPARLDFYFNHLTKESGSILTAIDSIDDEYALLKQDLIHQLINHLEEKGIDISKVAMAFKEILSSNEIYMQDDKIKEFVEKLPEAETPEIDLSSDQEDDQSVESQLRLRNQALFIYPQGKLKFQEKLNKNTLNGIIWENYNRPNVDLTGVSLINAQLENANFNGATLFETNFSDATLNRTKLNGAYLGQVSLNRAHLREAELVRANLTQARLERTRLNFANLNYSTLADSKLTQADFTGAKLKEAKLCNADLTNTIFKDANLAGADLTGARLDKTDFTGANLQGAQLPQMQFTGEKALPKKLCQANLSGSRMESLELQHADLSQAQLARTSWENCILTGANFEGADLTNATLTDATILQSRFKGANLTGATIELLLPSIFSPILLDLHFNHLGKSSGSVLTAIESIDNAYPELKQDLMRQVIEHLLKQKFDITSIIPALENIIYANPIYLEDPEIKELMLHNFLHPKLLAEGNKVKLSELERELLIDEYIKTLNIPNPE
jgi:uncharacterized protein YjbI with pentapeptide repeats